MGPAYEAKIEEYWQEDGVGTTGVTTLTKAAPSQSTDVLVVTGLQASGDAAAMLSLESPSGTILYRKRFTGAFNVSEQFSPGVMEGAPGQAFVLRLSASTSNCELNMQGHRIGG